MALLEIANLRTTFRQRDEVVHAVDDVSFTVDEGEVLGLVGESGCGKTVTGLSVMRLLPHGGQIDGGSIRLDGRELLELPERRMCAIRGNEIGMIFQDPISSLNPTKRIGAQVAETVAVHRGAGATESKRRALEVLKLVGIPSAEERFSEYPHQLSGGMRQRVMIAAALACEPKLLIADEPTTSLDPTIGAQIIALLERLCRELGMAMILVTHDLGVVAGLADRVIVMYAGKLAEGGTTEDIFDRRRHPYTEALLDAIPRLEGPKAGRLTAIPGAPPDLAAPPAGCRFHPRCPRARARCVTDDPSGLFDSASGHGYACWFPLDGFAHVHVRERDGELPVTEPPADSDQGGRAPRAGREPLLRVDQLVKNYELGTALLSLRRRRHVQAVSNVSFELGKGETLGLVGESGCGKSTTGRLVVAAETPTSGSVVFEGADLANGGRARREWRRDLQMVFQDPYSSLDPRMPVADIVAEPLAIHSVSHGAAQRQRVDELLATVGLPSYASRRYPHEFSGGQRQRIAIARALALSPKLIVADEPVSSLDVSIRAQIVNLLVDLQQEYGISYLLISHDVAVVRHCADRVAVMYLGKLVEIGPATDVIARPVHPYTEMLVRTIPVPDPKRERAKPRLTMSDDVPSAADPPSGCRFHTRCPRRQEICTLVEPPLEAFGHGHSAACHFPIQPAASSPNFASA